MRIATWMAALGLVVIGGTALAQGDVIAQRRAGLKRMGEHMEAFKPVVEAGGDVRPLVRQIDDMIAWYKGMPKLFPAGSDKGDTKAKPEIWQNFAEFESLNTKLVGHLEVMRTAAAVDDKAAFAAAYKAAGPQYCGACHRPFRNR
jgi:cytochrome c556